MLFLRNLLVACGTVSKLLNCSNSKTIQMYDKNTQNNPNNNTLGAFKIFVTLDVFTLHVQNDVLRPLGQQRKQLPSDLLHRVVGDFMAQLQARFFF